MSTTPQIARAERPVSGETDHQVTYRATPQLHQAVRTHFASARRIDRTLESTYFDAEALPLHHCGAMLRERGRVGKSKRTTEAKIPSGTGLVRLKGQAALTAAWALADQRQLRPVATQVKVRELLLIAGSRSKLAPDFVVALDHATITSEAGGPTLERCEIELQLFTALPWTRTVDEARLKRFHEFCRNCETGLGLVPAARSGYQAIPTEVLA